VHGAIALVGNSLHHGVLQGPNEREKFLAAATLLCRVVSLVEVQARAEPNPSNLYKGSADVIVLLACYGARRVATLGLVCFD
jgi:hypothetical protein